MRLATVDTLRGLAILAMILIHSTAYFLSSKSAHFLWNYSQFAVAAFYFCSAYLFFYKDHPPHLSNLLPYFKKRLTRLIKPYYLFLSGYFLLLLIFERGRLTLDFILRQLTLTTPSTDLNWAVLLFLTLAFIAPLVSYLFTHKRIYFWLFFLASLLSAVWLLFFRFPLNYKLIMWLPWSLIVFFALFFVKNEQKPWFYPVTGSAVFGVFIFSYFALLVQNRTIVQFDNKYPPNIFHLSYGLFFITALFYYLEKYPATHNIFHRTIHFFSIHSYPIFFIQFLVIYLLTHVFDYGRWGWAAFFAAVVLVTYFLEKAILLLFNPKGGEVLK